MKYELEVIGAPWPTVCLCMEDISREAHSCCSAFFCRRCYIDHERAHEAEDEAFMAYLIGASE